MGKSKKTLIWLFAIIVLICFAGCSKKTSTKTVGESEIEKEGNQQSVEEDESLTPTEQPTSTPTPEPTVEPTETPTPTMVITEVPEETDWYDAMLDTSVLSTGNNERLKKVIEKARNGEDVYLAAIGGSVTEGAGATNMKEGYAYQFFQQFKEVYGVNGGENVHVVGAGLGGTPSSLGVIRYERDVIEELEHLPDIVIIEYAVNDYAEVTGGRAYESMVNEILSEENDPAVILLFAVFQNKWNIQTDYIPVGNHYELPMVSIKDAIVKPYQEAKITDPEFFADQYHPTSSGHTIMSDCLMRLLKVVDEEEADAAYTKPETGRKTLSFVGTKMITSQTTDVDIEKGSFTAVDSTVQGFMKTFQSSFPLNWKHDKSAGNDSFVMKLTCKNLLLNYKTTSSATFGSAEVYVDGALKMTLNGMISGGWNNSNVVLILDEEVAGEHTIEIRMVEGQEDKEFTILAFGYTQ